MDDAEVAVIGGRGFLGVRTLAAFARADLRALGLSRRSTPRVDVADPTTFDALTRYRVVVDLSNGSAVSPLALARHAIEQGFVLLEATSDADAVRALVDGLATTSGPGSVVLGAGIFTGLSNLLARAVARDVGTPERVELFLSASPLSGAGGATVDLMTELLARPAISFEGGVERVHARIECGPAAPFELGARPTIRASFAEQHMLPRSVRAKNVEVYFSPRPSFIVPLFVMTPGWLNRNRVYRWLLNRYLRLVRGLVLRSRASVVEIAARATSSNGTSTKTLVTPDGMTAGGAAIAAMVEAILAQGVPPGLSYIDDSLALDPIVRRTNALGGDVRAATAVTRGAEREETVSSPSASE